MKPTTIQATGKRWKFLQLLGAVIAVAGIVGCINSDMKSATGAWSVLAFVIGGTVHFVGRVGAWWHHA